MPLALLDRGTGMQLNHPPAVDDLMQAPPPGIQRLALLGVIAVAIVHGGDVTFCVIEKLGDHQARGAKPGHVRCGGASQVVRREIGKLDDVAAALQGVID